MQDVAKETKEKLEKAKEFFVQEIQNVRTGRANGMLVEDIKVEVYGSAMRIKDMASITVPDATSILIIPWDKGNLKGIENAIQAQNLGVGVVNMGENIRVTLPELSAERREELKKMVAKKSEETKVTMRNIRRESIDDIKKAEKNKEIGEDMVERLEKEVQTILDKYIAELDEIVEKKNKEISV